MKVSSLILACLFSAVSFADDSPPPPGIAPDSKPPSGCQETVDGNFTIATALTGDSKIRRETAMEASDGSFTCTLEKGILYDMYGRVGSIVANRQFQFDGPPQAGAIYTGGWSVCKNGSLALGGSTAFWRCTSGEFQNLYDQDVADQCHEAMILVSMVNQPSSSSSSSIASSTAASTSSGAASTSSSSASASLTSSINGTVSTATPSASSASDLGATTLSSVASAGASSRPSESSSTGAAVPTRVPKRETFGAVIGILGAALIL